MSSERDRPIAIRVDGLGKRYRIRHQLARYTTLRDTIAEQVRRLVRRGPAAAPVEDFWALKDVSFEVARGEVLGIIGRNGAGKSTLLKILSRITEPTTGRVELDGRVVSLLEVGAGFHPELSGRENIQLNGAILGMTRAEIRDKFDEVVAFAEVEKFLDTPVKRYSSGMYMRLAFAVAAHLEPEILIVDEVLAVGDAEFQRKCLGKMKSVATSEGRTVLFVSHNMAAIETLCDRAILLRGGSIAGAGTVASQIEAYTHDRTETVQPVVGRPLGPALTLDALAFSPNPVHSGAPVEFSISLSSTEAAKVSELAILIYSAYGTRVAILDLRSASLDARVHPERPFTLRGRIAALPLVEGDYAIGLYIACGDVRADFFDLMTLSVSPGPSASEIPQYHPYARGLVELSYEFGVA